MDTKSQCFKEVHHTNPTPGCSMEKGKEYDDIIGYTVVVSVNASCSRYYNFALFLHSPHVVLLICLMYFTLFPHVILVYIV